VQPTFPVSSPPRFKLLLFGFLFLVLFIFSRSIATILLDYKWWGEMGQTDTWARMWLYRWAPVVAQWFILFVVLWLAHARGLKYAGTGLRQNPTYAKLSTVAALAIALAQEGGLGFIHKNMPIDIQCREVEKVKRSENGIIFDPVTLPPEGSVDQARQIMREQNISGIPIVTDGNELAGILTRRDLKFHEGVGTRPVKELMTKSDLITAPPSTTLEQAERILNSARVEKLLLVDSNGNGSGGGRKLVGMITMRDIDKTHQFPRACKDARARYAAAPTTFAVSERLLATALPAHR